MPLLLFVIPLLIIAQSCLAQSIQTIDTTRDTFTQQFYNRDTKRIDNITPSFTIQYLHEGDYILVDITTSLMYSLSNEWTLGAGWNRRVAYSARYHAFSNKPRTFGPRCFASYKIGWGLSSRVEVELMNAPVPPIIQRITADYTNREWIPGVFIGIEKSYRLHKHFKGSCLLMLRTFNPDHKSPYGDVLNVRFGFDFPIKRSDVTFNALNKISY